MSTNAELYDASRARIVELLTGADLSAPVPACPGWTVQDLVAHLAGGLGAFTARDFDAGEYANHGERVVHERRGQTLEEHLDEWATNRAEADVTLAGPMGGVLVAEVLSHEHDIRGALDLPGAREDPAVRVAAERPLQEIDRRLRESGAPAVRLVVDGEERVVGQGEPNATLRLSAFDQLRAIGGRRSAAQLRALDWDGEPRLDVFTLFGEPRTNDLVE